MLSTCVCWIKARRYIHLSYELLVELLTVIQSLKDDLWDVSVYVYMISCEHASIL